MGKKIFFTSGKAYKRRPITSKIGDIYYIDFNELVEVGECGEGYIILKGDFNE